ncbi:heterokaryon incompatibility protein-domain-containing protein [Hyaloscypha sp. PMI_1271]|nr:heterokaryon incompatibility protein-domain-containing protein [Hyaloscypha sp. PMI_1271]
MGEWLRDCVENHSDCPRSSISTLPTRVLYVDPDSNKLRLVITDGKRGNYVALSHCWGSIMPLKLTASTLHLYASGISMETLPKTFQDAVIIAKTLCIDYIWIDSLCILQDSPGDWASESSRMADVYTNALVTIAADQSADCTGGIFAERGEEDAKSLPIQVASCSCSYCTVFARWRRRRIYPFANHAADHFPARSGLHSRGWTLQERLLSTRMLHFTPTELVWECTTQISCECRIAGLVPGQHLIFKRAFMGGHIARRIHGALVDDVGRDHTLITQLHWQLVFYEFTARSLSVETDRLPALSGVTNFICRRSSQTYYFGLLHAHAVRGLLWRSFDDRLETLKTKRMPRDYAPSWSFGSITGRIDFLPEIEYFRTFRQSVTIHFISKQLSSANPYGPGTGILSIEGYMVPICVEDPKYAGARRGSYRLFVVKTPSFESKNPPHDYPKNRPWGYFEPDVDGLEEEISGGKPMYLLIIGTCGITEKRINETLGLMLTEESRAGEDLHHRRAGVFRGGGGFVMSRWAHFGVKRCVQIR